MRVLTKFLGLSGMQFASQNQKGDSGLGTWSVLIVFCLGSGLGFFEE